MARACMGRRDLAEKALLPEVTVSKAINGGNARPDTVGKIAKALGVDVTEIIEAENQNDCGGGSGSNWNVCDVAQNVVISDGKERSLLC